MPSIPRDVPQLEPGAALISNDVDERVRPEGDDAPHRVLIVTHLPALADGVTQWLGDLGNGWSISVRNADRRGAHRAVRDHQPTLVVATDECDLERIVEVVGAQTPRPRLLVIVLQEDVPREAGLVRMGVTAVVSATADRTDFLRAVEDVLRGRAVLSADAIAAAAVGPDRPADLTPRQRDVLEHLALGRSTAQIAEALVVTPSTVKTHIRHLQERLGVDGHLALVANAQHVLAARPTSIAAGSGFTIIR